MKTAQMEAGWWRPLVEALTDKVWDLASHERFKESSVVQEQMLMESSEALKQTMQEQMYLHELVLNKELGIAVWMA
jgi:hypothetical protein